MSCLHLFALAVLATCGFFCAVHANMEAKRMGSEFLGKRSRLDDVLLWDEELAARSPALRVARLLRGNRFAYDAPDEDDDLELAVAAKEKRIGSEFLGKRALLLPKRMGSEFLGRRKRSVFPDA
uniref:Putative secreted protein n=1 Tax=Amblyomma aureolatum TaxID=187763 RepID=A0A1E1WY75_9ACAR